MGFLGSSGSKQLGQGRERQFGGEADGALGDRLGGILFRAQSSGSKATEMRKHQVCVRNCESWTGLQRSSGKVVKEGHSPGEGERKWDRSGGCYRLWWHTARLPFALLLPSSSSWAMASWKVGAITLLLAAPSLPAFVTWPTWVHQSP